MQPDPSFRDPQGSLQAEDRPGEGAGTGPLWPGLPDSRPGWELRGTCRPSGIQPGGVRTEPLPGERAAWCGPETEAERGRGPEVPLDEGAPGRLPGGAFERCIGTPSSAPGAPGLGWTQHLGVSRGPSVPHGRLAGRPLALRTGRWWQRTGLPRLPCLRAPIFGAGGVGEGRPQSPRAARGRPGGAAHLPPGAWRRGTSSETGRRRGGHPGAGGGASAGPVVPGASRWVPFLAEAAPRARSSMCPGESRGGIDPGLRRHWDRRTPAPASRLATTRSPASRGFGLSCSVCFYAHPIRGGSECLHPPSVPSLRLGHRPGRAE